jgi:hypothetical protein
LNFTTDSNGFYVFNGADKLEDYHEQMMRFSDVGFKVDVRPEAKLCAYR